MTFARKLLLICLAAVVSGVAWAGVPPNPWLADAAYAISHHDPAQSDSTPVDGPRLGQRLTRADVKTVPLLWSSAPTYKNVDGGTVVIAANPAGIIKIRADGEQFTRVSSVPYPGREDVHARITDDLLAEVMTDIDRHRLAKNDWRLLFNSWLMYWKLEMNMRTFPSGAYSAIDRDGYHYTNYDRHFLVKSFDQNKLGQPLVPVKYANIVAQLPQEDAGGIDRILGITMTYDGHLVAAATGAVIVTDRDLRVLDYVLFPGEHVENSIAVDAGNGIYLVTSKYMHKLVWTGDKLSRREADGAWMSPYEVMEEGEAHARGAASHGSGTTPTLMGFGEDEDQLVIISDGSPGGANLVAFWRNGIPADFVQKPGTLSRRIADQVPIGFSETTIEASPAASDTGVIIVNSTYPEPGPIPMDLVSNAFLSGTTREPPRGVKKFEWLAAENRFVEAWQIDHIDNTDWMPPAVSTSNGLVYIANRREDNYEYLAADWETGEIVATWQFPDTSVLWNNWGGITVLLEDGDLLLGGFFAVKRYNTGHLR
jgi:hypothetical protein